MNSDNIKPSINEERDKNQRTKDSWDKASILLKPIGGIITAITIVILGAYTTSFIEKQKDKDNDVRLYTQLMSEREKAEQSLRTAMFKEIFDKVLKRPNSTKPTGGENSDQAIKEELRIIKTHVVGIDMISRNFHEFLDMKPLFTHVMWEIVSQRGKIKKDLGEDNFAKFCYSAGENWTTALPCQELRYQQIQLVGIARRVIRKQFDILAENGTPAYLEIPLEDVCVDKNLRTLQPMDPSCEKIGFDDEKDLELQIGECTRKANFKISVDRAYPNWNMAQVGITTSVTSGEGCNDQFKKVDLIKRTFWVGSFDFPMVDNTYISAHEKYAIILEKIDRKKKTLKLQMVYFPASEAGLQEKSYYQQKLLKGLIDQSGLFVREAQR